MAQIAYIKVDEAFTEVPSKYANFTDIFWTKACYKTFQVYNYQQLCHSISR